MMVQWDDERNLKGYARIPAYGATMVISINIPDGTERILAEHSRLRELR